MSCRSKYLASFRHLHDAHPVVRTLIDAIKARDISTYSWGHAQVVAAERTRAGQQQRMKVEGTLADAVPGLVDIVSSSLHDTAWDTRFGAWLEAWHWAVADAWLEKRSDFEYQQKTLGASERSRKGDRAPARRSGCPPRVDATFSIASPPVRPPL